MRLLLKILVLFAYFVLFSCFSGEKKVIKNKVNFVKNIPIKDVQQFGDWYFSNSGLECFIFSFPISSSGDYLLRSYNYMMINYNKSKNTKEIYIIGGLPYKEGSLVRVYINKVDFFFIPYNNQAWGENEEAILKKMFSSKENFLVFNDFKDNVSAIDKYSMLGFKQAFENLNNACVSVESI